MIRKLQCAALVVCGVSWPTSALAQGDPAVIDKIVDQGKNHSRVMEFLDHLAIGIGPRLTGSSRVYEANVWTRDTFASFGITNAHLFKWGDIPVGFDRGPGKVRMIKPTQMEFEFTTRSWTAGTNGLVKGVVVKQPKNMEEFESMKESLNGKWVLAKPRPRGRFPGAGGGGGPGGSNRAPEAPAAEGAAPRAAPPPAPPPPPTGDGVPAPPDAQGPSDREGGPTSRPARRGQQPDPDAPLVKAMYEAGILGRIVSSGNELLITSGAPNWRELDYKKLPTEVSITVRRSDYDALNSRLADGEEVVIEADLQHHFVEGPLPVFDTVAEIPGTEHPEQVIIVSGHLDSWDGPGSQGAQDNGVGSSTTLETARILTAAGVKPKRTIRFCLWTGEEEGLLGSKAYVKALTDEEKANISAVFVDDGGTNYDGGLQCVANMEPMLTAAVAPVNKAFPDMPVKVNVRQRMPRAGASDHASFNQVGVPGFFWDEEGKGGQEGKDYNFIHHTQNDTTRYVVPEYLVQSATCAAITAYNLAMADTLLPRYVPPTEKPETPESPETSAEFIVAQGPLSGEWEGEIVRPQNTGGQGNGGGGRGMGGFTIALEMSADNRVRGTSSSRMGEMKITGGTFDPKSKAVQWKIKSEFMGTITYDGTVDGDAITGKLSNDDGEFEMPFKATRTSKGPAPIPATADQKPAAEKQPTAEKTPAAGAGS